MNGHSQDEPTLTLIPRILHQTHSDGNLPPVLAANVASLKARNPNWEHRFYDDAAQERFIAAEYDSATLRAYRRLAPDYGAARADFFRYLLLYRVGGVYLDIKSRFNCPIDEVLTRREGFVVSYWSNRPGERYEGFGLHPALKGAPRGEIQQWHVISAPGHPFLAAMIETVLRNIEAYRPWRQGSGKKAVLEVTGPIAYTRTLLPLLDRHPCRIVDTEAVLSLDYSVLEGRAHQTLFARHYSQNRHSLVRFDAPLSWIDRAYHLGRGAYRRLRPRRTA